MRRLLAAGIAVAAALVIPATAARADSATASAKVTPYRHVAHEVGAGTFRKIYDPSVGETGPWYINDHTIVRGRDGTWHLFGITHAEPADPEHEIEFAHATAPSLHGPWTKQAPALTVDPAFGETHLWAPHVISWHGTYYMFYNGGGGSITSEISLATSKDLWHWTRDASDPLFTDGYDARDPFVLRLGNRWVLYYCATSNPTGGHHIVAYRYSTDLVHWGAKHVAFTDPSTGTFGGPTESPFVVHHNGRWYLFGGPRPGYVGTDVFVSDDPLHFSVRNKVGHIASHALEVVRDTDGSWWVTSAGWGQGGVSLAPLSWDRKVVYSGYDVAGSAYHARVQAQPSAELTALSTKDGGRWRNVLDDTFRGTLPYLGVSSFGSTDMPGAPARVSAKNGTVALDGVPLGDEPVTVDWRFAVRPSYLDMALKWHVRGALSAPAYETSWSLDTTLTTFGDDGGLDRTGDVHGFPKWTLAGDAHTSLVAAYQRGSAWAEANHYFDPADGALSWQPLWNPAGQPWAPGDYAGGVWRLGISNQPRDTGLAQRLYAGINGS